MFFAKSVAHFNASLMIDKNESFAEKAARVALEEKSQHGCIRWALCEHLTPPCSDFACGGLEDHHHKNKKIEFKGNKLDRAHLQLLFISCCLICNHNYLVIYV